jgi:hypothetical protein
MSWVTEASAEMTERVTQTSQKSPENGPKIEKNCQKEWKGGLQQ